MSELVFGSGGQEGTLSSEMMDENIDGRPFHWKIIGPKLVIMF